MDMLVRQAIVPVLCNVANSFPRNERIQLYVSRAFVNVTLFGKIPLIILLESFATKRKRVSDIQEVDKQQEDILNQRNAVLATACSLLIRSTDPDVIRNVQLVFERLYSTVSKRKNVSLCESPL
jgi:hypothetical protein